MQDKQATKLRRQKRVRAKIFGTHQRPRLCVFRSGKHIYAQLVDDEKGKTLVSAKDQEIKSKGKKKSSSDEKNGTAFEVGKLLAEKALKDKIDKAVFDKREYAYHGKVKALAEGAREGGLRF